MDTAMSESKTLQVSGYSDEIILCLNTSIMIKKSLSIKTVGKNPCTSDSVTSCTPQVVRILKLCNQIYPDGFES